MSYNWAMRHVARIRRSASATGDVTQQILRCWHPKRHIPLSAA